MNETYYAFQKAARLMGSNHVDLCARLCHAASVAGLKDTLGIAAPTCSLQDLIGSDRVRSPGYVFDALQRERLDSLYDQACSVV